MISFFLHLLGRYQDLMGLFFSFSNKNLMQVSSIVRKKLLYHILIKTSSTKKHCHQKRVMTLKVIKFEELTARLTKNTRLKIIMSTVKNEVTRGMTL